MAWFDTLRRMAVLGAIAGVCHVLPAKAQTETVAQEPKKAVWALSLIHI